MARIRARSCLTMVAILLVFGAIVFVLWLGAHAVCAAA
jgi:ATP-binding cassette subfamily B protein